MAASLRLGGGALRELRIHLCQKSASSNGVRAFIEQVKPAFLLLSYFSGLCAAKEAKHGVSDSNSRVLGH
jgi:hypothetical protein